ncbi:MAG: hypothetical protein KDI82_14050 [Gammaproteobacteria bacterium]|nr:hypothetical protein [Gammaproteobacteria bacterium]
MTGLSDDLLSQLLDLIDSLRGESAEFLANPGDQQLWYNRGYANGMLTALYSLGAGEKLGQRKPDPAAEIDAHAVMAWGRAYRHGESVGSRETFEIIGNPAP